MKLVLKNYIMIIINRFKEWLINKDEDLLLMD